MITRYKNISIKKLSDNPEGKKPSHSLVVSDDKYEKKETVGSFWTRDGNYGKFLSGKLSNTREFAGKVYEGYVIVSERELDNLITKINRPDYPVEGVDEGVEDPSSIPFS